MLPLALYIHWPFCAKKCPYCDFNSHAWGPAMGELPQAAYIQAVVADLQQALPLVWGRPVHSVFIGGGTPSLFSPQGIDALLAGIRARVRLDADAEITLEANPGTFEKDRFRGFAQAGVTRFRPILLTSVTTFIASSVTVTLPDAVAAKLTPRASAI